MILDDLKREGRDRTSIEQRLEGKNKEIKILKAEID
jgi:hypothetical protein